jgi:hypothetical protein
MYVVRLYIPSQSMLGSACCNPACWFDPSCLTRLASVYLSGSTRYNCYRLMQLGPGIQRDQWVMYESAGTNEMHAVSQCDLFGSSYNTRDALANLALRTNPCVTSLRFCHSRI